MNRTDTQALVNLARNSPDDRSTIFYSMEIPKPAWRNGFGFGTWRGHQLMDWMNEDELASRIVRFDFFTLIIPWWPIAVLTFVPLAVTVRGKLKRRFAPKGYCPHCGYDLRATPDQCPECGRIPK